MPSGPGAVSSPPPRSRKPDRDAPPTIQPLKPSQATEGKIAIPFDPKAALKGHSKAADTFQYWMNYYRKHDESAADVKEKVTLLNFYKKTRDVEAILKGYLWAHPKNAEPWMYEALALAIEMNKGKATDAKTSLKYAADVAEKTRNPNHLLSVADQLFLHGEYARAAPLIDEAIGKLPHRAEPLMMSINLAAKTKDPERMATSVDKLLSLGWPGYDEKLRRDAHRVADTLAKALREENRDAEAETLTNRLTESESRDLYVRLSLGRRRRARPDGRRASRRDREVRGPAHRLRRLDHQGRLRQASRGGLRLPPRLRRRLHDPRRSLLQQPRQAGAGGDPGGHHARGDVAGAQADAHDRAERQGAAPVVVHLEGGRRKAVLPFVAPPQPATAAQDAPRPKEKEAAAGAKAKEARPATTTSKAAATPPAGPDGVRARLR